MKVKIHFLAVLLLCAMTVFPQSKRETRAVWLAVNHNLDWPQKPARSQSDIENLKAALDRLLDRLQEAHINAVFFQTRIRGSVAYISDIEPLSEFIADQKSKVRFDALQYAIDGCHKRNMELHAWFVVYPLGKNPSNSLARSQMTKKFKNEYYLDPGHPQTTPYLLRIINELVSKYDIDGLHFDYIRYPDGSAAFPDSDLFGVYGKKLSLADWRRENINSFVSKAFDEVKLLKPWVAVSSSVVGMYDFIEGESSRHWTALHSVFQDPVEWIKRGKHDFIVPMLYNRDKMFFPFAADWIKRVGADRIVGGLGVYMIEESGWNADVIAEQIEFLRKNDVAGVSLFRTRNLTGNSKGIFTRIAKTDFRTPALPPALVAHLDDIQPPVPEKFMAEAKNEFLYLSWKKPLVENDNSLTYNVYRSAYTPVDTSNPRNLIATRLPIEGCKIRIDNSKETVYYYTVTAFDRFRNESVACGDAMFITGDFEK
jgi:uncharacterized lipoprotein YddW (UPF0748 family)